MTTTGYTLDGATLRGLDWQPQRTLRWAAWRPDGARLVAVGNGGCAVLSDGRALDYVDTRTKQNLRGAAWSPDGSTALLAGNRGAVLRLRGEAIDELAAPTTENLRRVAWHPGGEYALIVGNAGVVLRYEARDGGLTALPGDRAHTLRSIAFRPDGAYALIGAYASKYAGYPRPHPLYRADGRFLQSLLASDDEDDFVSVDWSTAGRALVCGYATDAGGTLMNKALTFDGSSWQTQTWPANGILLGAAWRPGHEEAVLVGEAGLLLLLKPDGSLEALDAGTNDNLIGPFWRPDGSDAVLLKGPDERVYTV